MAFICINENCDIAQIGAVFPKAINCLHCKSPLVNNVLLSQEDIELINKLPYVIAYPLKRTLEEENSVIKINLFRDTFLNYLKYIGLITASEFFNSSLKDKNMVTLFNNTLAEPSFGKWNHYIRETLKYLKEKNHTFFCSGVLEHYEDVQKKKIKLKGKNEIVIDLYGDEILKTIQETPIGILINFRNTKLGHGQTPSESVSRELWEEYFPIFRELLQDLSNANVFTMFKNENGKTYKLMSAQISEVEKGKQKSARVWIENPQGETMNVLPFYIVPGEVSLTNDDIEQILIYESYTGKSIKFFSPEGTERLSSGPVLRKLNILLKNKQNEIKYTPEEFTKDIFLKRINDENDLMLESLISEKKIIPGIYINRKDLESKLNEWIGSSANIFFIAAEAGSGKTNLLVEIQKQYTNLELPCILIRAGRMEKSTLQEEIAYILNIDATLGFEHYHSLAGTQEKPTFILIDGLNEAVNAEAIWNEIILISRVFAHGSLKFVVTSRANTANDLHRFPLSESDYDLFYRNNPEEENSPSNFNFWLTPLNMLEMQELWNNYVKNNKKKYNPLFTFEDIGNFDWAIYYQINNPLVMRLFLETYHQKPIPKNGVKHLFIWRDWLSSFSPNEKIFLKLLVEFIWEKGENELLIDDLINNTILKPYFDSDVLSDPYPRLKNLGWISRYSKDLNGYLSFTVEGALLYMLGDYLYEQRPGINFETASHLLISSSKLKRFALEEMLCAMALNENLTLTAQLIDTGDEYLDICTKPLLLYLKTFGVSKFFNEVLHTPTDNDWKALLKLYENLTALRLYTLRKEFLMELMKHNTLDTIEAIWLGLKSTIAYFDKSQTIQFLTEIHKSQALIDNDHVLLELLGQCVIKHGDYDQGLTFYEKSLKLKLRYLGENHSSVAQLINNIGHAYVNKAELDKGLKYYEEALNLKLKRLDASHPSISASYNNIGTVWRKKGMHEKALSCYNKSIDIKLKSLGPDNPSLAPVYNNIGFMWADKGEADNALEWYYKSLEIKVKNFGEDHNSIATSYRNIASAWKEKGEYQKAINYYSKSLVLKKKYLGNGHRDVTNVLMALGNCHRLAGDLPNAIDTYNEGYIINKNGVFLLHIGSCYEDWGKSKDAFDTYIMTAEKEIENGNNKPDNDILLKAVSKSKLLAQQHGFENQLPNWIDSIN